ncbi:MAG: LysR family transcriptional regulator, partial [Proteobacteria bacterium]|nr:LysR family transcriptional regulator [Pseudomonadota bacterium]
MMPAVLAIEIRHLRHVIAAADHHSFRKAAEALRLKQSTLSRSIRQMEDQLGVALFERNAAGVRPTQAGTDLLRAARCLVEDFQMMLSHAWNAGEGRAGQIAIGFYGSLAGGSLRATVLDYNRRCPAVKLLLTESARGRLLKGLKSGALDVAIVSGDLNQLSSQTMTLWSERVFVALSQD